MLSNEVFGLWSPYWNFLSHALEKDLLSCWRTGFTGHQSADIWNSIPLCPMWCIGRNEILGFCKDKIPIVLIEGLFLRTIYDWLRIIGDINYSIYRIFGLWKYGSLYLEILGSYHTRWRISHLVGELVLRAIQLWTSGKPFLFVLCGVFRRNVNLGSLKGYNTSFLDPFTIGLGAFGVNVLLFRNS